MKILDLGCGKRKVPGAIGVDIDPCSSADIIFDLNRTPYPFQDNVFDRVYARHILEHLEDIVAVMKEIHRISKPGAHLLILTPHFSSYSSFTDISHKHHFASGSFDIFDPSLCGEKKPDYPTFRILEKRLFFDLIFKKIRVGRFQGIPIFKILGWEALANLFLPTYERFFSFAFPSGGTDLMIKMEVIK